MAKTFTSPILTLILFILFTASSCSILSTNTGNSVDNFIQCFQALTHFSAAHTLHTNTSSDYQSILLSSAQNNRFLTSAATRKPAVIITSEEEEQVSVIVRCAYIYDLQLRVRSGGHDYEGNSYVVPNDRIYVPFVDVDLALLNKVDVDAGNRTAWVQAGATLGEVYYNTFTKTGGVAGFPGGNELTVGVGGHISVGGIGPMSRKFGTAADNVVDAKVVGTCGEVWDRKTMGEELFWAIRGGGAASFGIVVAYKIKLVDVPPLVGIYRTSRTILAGKDLNQNATQLLTRWVNLAPTLDENLYLEAIVNATLNFSGVVNINVQFTAFFLGNRTQFLGLMRNNFPELNLRRRQQLTMMDWSESVLFMNGLSGRSIDALLNRTQKYPFASFKGKSDFVTQPITESEWETIFKFLNKSLTAPVLRDQLLPFVLMTMQPMGGRMSQISEAAIPFPHRSGNLYNIQYLTRWFSTSDQDTRKHLDLMRNISNFMTPFVSSNPRAAYYGYKDIDLGRNKGVLPSYNEARVWGERYFKNNFERLARIKRKVDAGNYFRNEQSIPPYNSWEVPPQDALQLEVSLQCSTSTCICTSKL